jgi:hypothetical protein
MANNAADVEAIAWRTLLATRGEPISYRVHEDLTIEDFVAVVTRPQTNSVDVENLSVIESRAWNVLINPDDLVDPLTGDRIEPRSGHLITVDSGLSLKVQPSDGSQLAWRWNSSNQIWRRINAAES